MGRRCCRNLRWLRALIWVRYLWCYLPCNAELETYQAGGPQMVEHLRSTLPAIWWWLLLPIRIEARAFIRHKQHSTDAHFILCGPARWNLHAMACPLVRWSAPNSLKLLRVQRMGQWRDGYRQLTRLLWSMGWRRHFSTSGCTNHMASLRKESSVFLPGGSGAGSLLNGSTITCAILIAVMKWIFWAPNLIQLCHIKPLDLK